MNFFECCRTCVYDRYPGCASHCEKYAAARAKYDAAMNSLKYKENDTYAIELFRKRNDTEAKYQSRRSGKK